MVALSFFFGYLKRVGCFLLVVGPLFLVLTKKLWTLALLASGLSRLKVAFESGKFHSDQPEIQDSVKSTGRSFLFSVKVCLL